MTRLRSALPSQQPHAGIDLYNSQNRVFTHPMHKLHGKRALVTAGAQGIGLAISRQLLAAGCDVFVHYRSSADAARGLEAEAKALTPAVRARRR